MRKFIPLLLFLFLAAHAVAQLSAATAYGLIMGRLEKGKWQYSPLRKINKIIEFSPEKITIKDSSDTITYRLLKDVVSKHLDEDSCITSLRTGYNKDNVRCMVNLVEFYNGVNVLNILYNRISYSYYFRRSED